jgi:transposase
MRADSGQLWQAEVRTTPLEEATMPTSDRPTHSNAAVGSEAAAVFASLELSRSRWLITSLLPGSEKISKHWVAGGDGDALLVLLKRLRDKVEQRTGTPVEIVVIQEVGLDGFWIHRLLVANGIDSHVVEPASIAVPRRHRRVKTDTIDGATLLRTLMAFKRGEPRVCSMVVPPSPEEEDRRRIARERRTLIKERIEHINRIKGLLAFQGITGYQPMRRDCRERLEELQTGDGRPLPPRLKDELSRELDRIELVRRQIAVVEVERDALVQSDARSPAALLMQLRGIGPEFLWMEGLFRNFSNRRQLAAYAGLAPSPWQSGGISGISKSGNPRLRTTMIELAWLWLRHQPDSALSHWFRAQVQSDRGRIRRISIVAMARKLLIALWRYTTQGEVPPGATLKAA